MIRRALAFAFVFFGLALVGSSQESSRQVPSLTEVQRLQLIVLKQRLEIAQWKAQAVQTEFQAARRELDTLSQSLQVEGFSLDLDRMAYNVVEPSK